jgi:hypothetical protein
LRLILLGGMYSMGKTLDAISIGELVSFFANIQMKPLMLPEICQDHFLAVLLLFS